jgi:hypothetical protein
MITDKRLAEIRESHDLLNDSVIDLLSSAELLELVQCYEAARAYAQASKLWRANSAIRGRNLSISREALFALFPEATND